MIPSVDFNTFGAGLLAIAAVITLVEVAVGYVRYLARVT